MRRALVALALTGCNQVYGLDPTTLGGPTECATIRFGPPAELAQFAGGDDEVDPQLSADGLELWFAHQVQSTEPYTIYRGVRGSLAEPFTVARAEFAQTDAVEPALTADGKRLLFRERGVGLVEAVREDLAAPFQLRVVVGVPGVGQGVDLSWDGLRLYYVDFDATLGETLYVAERPSLDEPFGESIVQFAEARYPTVSPDELEVFYNRPGLGGMMFRRSRPSRDVAFGAEELVLDEGYDPDVNPGADTLIVARDGGLALLERVCPGK